MNSQNENKKLNEKKQPSNTSKTENTGADLQTGDSSKIQEASGLHENKVTISKRGGCDSHFVKRQAQQESINAKQAYQEIIYAQLEKKTSGKSNFPGALPFTKQIKITDPSTNAKQNPNSDVKNNQNPNLSLKKKNSSDPKPKINLSINKNGMICLKPSNGTVSKTLAGKTGATYFCKTNEWAFRTEDWPDVMKALKKEQMPFEKIPAGVISIAQKTRKEHDFELKEGIYDRLLNFQRTAVQFALNRNGRVLLGDEMGLGKTVQALAIAKYYALEFPLLIICPASLIHQWRDSVQQFLECDATVIKERADFGDKISIISYNLSSTFADNITDNFKVIICDECHYLKSTKSKRTQQLLPILQRCCRLIMASGTPALSRPVELFPVLMALKKDIFSSYMEYGMRYCNGRKIKDFYDFRGSSHAEELLFVLEKEFMIKRNKIDVLKDLPKKSRRQVVLEVDKSKSAMQNADNKELNLIGNKIDGNVMKLYNEAVEMKKAPVLKYVQGLLEKGIKFLVYAHHKEMLDWIEQMVVEKGTGYIRIDGSIAGAKRHSLVEDFQSKDSVQIAILSLTACSTGLTLTAGKAVVFAELYWNPGTMMQAEDRIHRIGQSDNVDIHYLVCKQTIDEIVWPLLAKKLSVLEKLGLGKNEYKKIDNVHMNQRSLDGFLK